MLRLTPAVAIDGRLVYRRGERGLDIEPRPGGGVASLLVNDVQIEVDEEAQLLYVWGYCPHESWKPATLEVPASSAGGLQLVEHRVVPGVSRRLNDAWWPTWFDAATGWLCIGDASARGGAVAFAPGALAALVDGELAALWLRPHMTA